MSNALMQALRRPRVIPRGGCIPALDGIARSGTAIAWALGLALVAATLLALHSGAVTIHAADWWAPWSSEAPSGGAYVLWQLRFPRVMLALVVGAALGLSGALAQALFRNPMADPGLLGVTSGAACAAALALTVFAGAQLSLPPAWRQSVVPAAAFVGAVSVCLALDRLARWLTPGSVPGLLLAGLALNAVAMSVLGLCTYLASDEQLRSLTFWTLGSLAGASWFMVGSVGLALAGALWMSRRLAPALNALALGEAAAGHVGIDVQRLRRQLVLTVALLCALAVAWCGLIGFIGLIAPHLVRRLAGADQRRVAPLAAAAGALLLLVGDTLARSVAIPAEIPVGIFTALLGGPVFLLMLRGAADLRGAGMTIEVKQARARLGRRDIGPFDLRIRAAERVAVLGPSGAGKSTLLKLMAGEHRAATGEVRFDGRSLADWSLPALAQRRAVLPQSHSVAFALPVTLVVGLGRVAREHDPQRDVIVAEALACTRAAHLAGRHFQALSGGEQARVQLARVLAQLWDVRDGVLLVDEPLAALDPGLALDLMQSLLDFAAARGHAVVAVLHDLNQALRHFERLLGVADGGCVQFDLPSGAGSVGALEQLFGIELQCIDNEELGLAVLPRRRLATGVLHV